MNNTLRILQFSIYSLLLVLILILIIKEVEAQSTYSCGEINGRWMTKLDASTYFLMNKNNSPLISQEDSERIFLKFKENITQGNIENIDKIVTEENIIFKINRYSFFLTNNTQAIRLEIDALWNGILLDEGGMGYFEITLRNEGKIVIQDSYPSTEAHFSDTIQYENPNSRNWTIEIGGTGLQSKNNSLYNGEYKILVRAYEEFGTYEKHNKKHEEFPSIVFLFIAIVFILFLLILTINYWYPTKK